METFLRALLDSQDEHRVWFMDEVDKLFLAPFASDFFGLVRSWHNSRSTEQPVELFPQAEAQISYVGRSLSRRSMTAAP